MSEEIEDKQSVSSDLIRGHINTIILRALYDGDKYGYEIISEIERKSHGQYSLKQPSLYSALKRLESDGYITSYWGGSVSGGRRKYFSLTDAGKKISEINQSEWEYSRTVIDSLISDKDFDFSNPAPGLVDMRVLRDTTTRTPTSREEEAETKPEQNERELSEKHAELNEKQTQIDEELAKIAEERSLFEENAFRLEEERLALQEASAKLEQERKKYEEEMEARNDAFLREREWREREIAERERRLEQEKDSLKDNKTRISDEEKLALEERIRDQERELNEQRDHYEEACTRYEEEIEKLRISYTEELARREQQIREEQEEAFRQREKELLHRNFMELISSPPAQTENTTYEHVSPPVGDEPPEEESITVEEEEDETDYRPAVRKIFANTMKTDAPTSPAPTVRESRVTSLDGIDFYDLEACAERDGIRIYTAGGKPRSVIEKQSKSIVHKGKALFISSIFFFAFCVILGSVILGISGQVSLPVYYPYLIWGIGLVVLLIAGIAFANRYGEHSLRSVTPAIINAIVLYVLLVIVTLIIALAVNIDFTDRDTLATFVTVPVIFFVGVLVFGTAYYIQVRPKK